ncbi:peptidylprolyl isomerase SurA [Pseudidiomarina aestuarii]|uniref:Chaperone SurA n=1 Tax=Pseudidiomarina aestuarii TaxID=624146 RepID=A0A7Z6ZRK0_9GAMM|nr:peptidylprolyl isomerase SurA [Pseudidiomarina aestuarii]RUO38051.1 peptidylprolyl isomerase SurA [Pseudidiomarina aestuarii]
MKQLYVLLCAAIIGFTSVTASAQELDRVAVIVNDGVVLESEVQQMLRQVKQNAQRENMSLPADEVLRVQAIDRLVLRELQLQMAQRMGIEVSDAQLQATLTSIAQDSGVTIDQMREQIASDGMSWDNYRESVRREMITGQVQRNAVQQRVYVSPQEINNLTKMISEMSEQEVEYRLSHILIGVRDGASSAETQEARERAEQVLERLRNGADFAEAAITTSSGNTALEGGDLGWMNINAMPTLFAEVVRDKRKGELVGPLKSGVGFHILKVADTRGIESVEIEEVNARHILIQPSIILSDKRAEEMLQDYRQQIISGEATFADLAREHSADPGSAADGGNLGWNEPNIFADAFRRVVETAPVGEISEPFKSEFGWHIVEVLDRRTQDATERSQQNRAYQLLFSRKYQEELENWQQEIRDQAYIEQVGE